MPLSLGRFVADRNPVEPVSLEGNLHYIYILHCLFVCLFH